jgi:hypothetical protein
MPFEFQGIHNILHAWDACAPELSCLGRVALRQGGLFADAIILFDKLNAGAGRTLDPDQAQADLVNLASPGATYAFWMKITRLRPPPAQPAIFQALACLACPVRPQAALLAAPTNARNCGVRGQCIR